MGVGGWEWEKEERDTGCMWGVGTGRLIACAKDKRERDVGGT